MTENNIEITIPLLIRLMELAREELKTDIDIHVIAERMGQLARSVDCFTMREYQKILDSLTDFKK